MYRKALLWRSSFSPRLHSWNIQMLTKRLQGREDQCRLIGRGWLNLPKETTGFADRRSGRGTLEFHL